MISEKDAKRYSFRNAIKHLADRKTGIPGSCFEQEISQDTEKRFGAAAHGGLLIPYDLPCEVRTGLATTSNAAGGYAVQTTIQPLIDLLRNQMTVRAAGATVMEGLTDTVAFPKQLTPGTANWVGENPGSDNADSDVTLGQITMSPKMLTASTSYSRKLMAQSSVDVEGMVRNDLMAITALAIDLAALNGSGASNQPLGLLGTTGVNAITWGADGAAPSYADFCSMENLLDIANVPANGPRSFILTPEVRNFCRKTARVSGQYLGAILSDNGQINGHDVFVTNQLPKALTRGIKTDCHAGLFGRWDALLIGLWGGAVELIVDEYTSKKQGMVQICSYAMADINCKYPVAFSFSKYWSGATL